jgi:hypothetical protein
LIIGTFCAKNKNKIGHLVKNSKDMLKRGEPKIFVNENPLEFWTLMPCVGVYLKGEKDRMEEIYDFLT